MSTKNALTKLQIYETRFTKRTHQGMAYEWPFFDHLGGFKYVWMLPPSRKD